ncbi:MAG: hypothetical protein ACFE9I_04275 [Candidatus Hermodarchaeota archaeon]
MSEIKFNKNETNDENSEKVEKSSFLYRRKPVHLYTESSDDKFDVIVPKKNIIIFVAIFLVLFFIQFIYFSGLYYKLLFPNEPYNPGEFYWWAPLAFIAIAIIPILAWGQIGARFASRSMVKYLRKTVSKKRPKPAEILLGYPLRTKDIYYLETFPMDLNLGKGFASIKVFIKRLLNVLFLSMGMSVVLSQVVAPYIYAPVSEWDPDLYFNIEEMIIDLTIYLGPFTLLILMFVMPVFWVAEDTQAYRVNEYQDSVRLGYYLRTGILSKILGFFGLVIVYNLAQEFASALLAEGEAIEPSLLMSSPGLAIQVYTTTFIWFGIILGMCAAIPFLVTLVYLSIFHERWVNNVRIKASEFMDLGTLEVREPSKVNLQYMENPKMIDETGGFFQTKLGRVTLIILIIVAALICFYLSFILGFEEALF